MQFRCMEEKQLDNNLFLQKIFACPSCRNSLSFEGSNIRCNSCGNIFRVEKKIYRMIGKDLSNNDEEQQCMFDKISEKYDSYLYSQPIHVKIKNDYVYPHWFENDFKDKVVLDLGCGTGWAGERIVKNCKLLVNLDISVNNLILASKKLGDQNAIYIQADMKKLPFNINSFDIVICFGALHHLEEPLIAAREISKVLSDTGIFLGFEPNIKYTWVDFWSDILHLPVFLKGFIKDIHKRIQKVTKGRLEKEEWYMNGFEINEDYHAGVKTPEELRGYFEDVNMKAETLDIGLEIVPPRFFMSKNRFLVSSLLNLSDRCIKYFNKNGKGIFFLIRAVKENRCKSGLQS